jgi:hypothetical protein
MNKDQRHSRSLIHIVQCDALSDPGNNDLRIPRVLLRKGAARNHRDGCSQDQGPKFDGTDS